MKVKTLVMIVILGLIYALQLCWVKLVVVFLHILESMSCEFNYLFLYVVKKSYRIKELSLPYLVLIMAVSLFTKGHRTDYAVTRHILLCTRESAMKPIKTF